MILISRYERKKKKNFAKKNLQDILLSKIYTQCTNQFASPSPRMGCVAVILWEAYDRLSRLHPRRNPRITIHEKHNNPKNGQRRCIETATGEGDVIVHRVIHLIVNNYGRINSILRRCWYTPYTYTLLSI